MRKLIVSSILAGIAVSIGGIAFLATGNPWFFPIGLCIVCFYNLHLFTGRICYFRKRNHNLHEMLMMYICNAAGAYLTGRIVALAKPIMSEDAAALASRKLAEGFGMIPLAILCNVMIFVAVDTYRRTKTVVGVIFATAVFVACGFEHCIANAFYFGMAQLFSGKILVFLLANGLWNAVGGICAKRLLCSMKGE